MNTIKKSNITSWLVPIMVITLAVVGMLGASLSVASDTVIAGDNWENRTTDDTPADRRESAHNPDVRTSVLPADMDIIDLLVFTIWIMTAGVGVLAVGGIVWGAIMYASAGGSQEKTKKGIEIIRNVVIGLLLYVFMFAAVNFLIPGGVIT